MRTTLHPLALCVHACLQWGGAGGGRADAARVHHVTKELLRASYRGLQDKHGACLPMQVRVLGFERVTKGFDARLQCDRRRYEYILPAAAFRRDPAAKPAVAPGAPGAARVGGVAGDSGGADAPANAANGDSACAEAAGGAPPESRGPRTCAGVAAAGDPAHVAAEAGAARDSAGPLAAAAQPPAAAQDGAAPQAGGGALPCDLGPAEGGGAATPSNGPPRACAAAAPAAHAAGADAAGAAHASLGLGPEAPGSDAGRAALEAPLSEAEVAAVDAELARYEGTHSFHNFTVRMAAGDAAAKRFILSFRVAGALTLQARPGPGPGPARSRGSEWRPLG